MKTLKVFPNKLRNERPLCWKVEIKILNSFVATQNN